MARCLQLTTEQSRQWDEGSWSSIALEDDIFELCYKQNMREPVIVVTSEKKIAFALDANQRRA
jgi:hypothetical protein